MNFAILLSGGKGTRIDSEVPKQYVRVNGLMMITYPLKTLVDSEYIDGVFIVAEKDWRDEILADAENAGIDAERILGFSAPGPTRQLSIYNGMEEIMNFSKGSGDGKMSDADTVLVHDAARPFLTKELLGRCYDAMPGFDGVMPVLPMKDTVYYSNDGREVSELLDRSRIFAGQAPELFIFNKYYNANLSLLPLDILNINGATEPAIKYGMKINMIPGDEGNYKVTTDADMRKFRESLPCN